jgi:hypothetical protein
MRVVREEAPPENVKDLMEDLCDPLFSGFQFFP